MTDPLTGPQTGARNLITDVQGLKVGSASDAKVRTGVTVILADHLAAAAVDVSGGGPGTRETDALRPESLVGSLDAVFLSGGSVYGLGSGDAVAAALGARGRGFRLREGDGVPPSPLVGGAILYDLANGGDKAWGETPPYPVLARRALEAAAEDFALGTEGAGYGAFSGMLKGGLGSASGLMADGTTVGAVVAVNSFGSVVGPDGRTFWAAPYELGQEFGGGDPGKLHARPDAWPHAKLDPRAGAHTTICCVATDAALNSVELKRVAIMARAGMARAIRPVFSPVDGDVIFALSTGKRQAAEPRTLAIARIGALAADTLTRAIARGVYEARAWEHAPAPDWRSVNAAATKSR